MTSSRAVCAAATIGAIGQFDGGIKLVRRRCRLGLLPPGPAFIAGDHQHDQNGSADDQRPGLLPELAHAVAPQLFVNFADKRIFGHETLGEPVKIGGTIFIGTSECKCIRRRRFLPNRR